MRDTQQEAPVCACRRCGGEIYREDLVAWQAGGLLHAGCLGREEREGIAPAFQQLEEHRDWGGAR